MASMDIFGADDSKSLMRRSGKSSQVSTSLVCIISGRHIFTAVLDAGLRLAWIDGVAWIHTDKRGLRGHRAAASTFGLWLSGRL